MYIPAYDHSLDFKLHKVVFLLDRVMHRALQAELDLTFSQFLILMAVKRHGHVSQRHVASFLMLTDAAVSRQIELAFSAKLIEKAENPDNRRESILSLTSKGKLLLERARDTLKTISDTYFSSLTHSEHEVVDTALTKLLAALCVDTAGDCTHLDK